jgi:CBS domain-containing protein
VEVPEHANVLAPQPNGFYVTEAVLVAVQDILRAREKGTDLSTEVWRVMSTPAVTVRGHAHVGEAAAVMLARKVHRLPVVDNDQRLIGCAPCLSCGL